MGEEEALIDVAGILARAESSSIHARIARDRPHELGDAVRARLEIGFHISAHDYLQAGRLRARLTREFVDEVFGQVDAVLTPTIPEPPPVRAAETGRSATAVSAIPGNSNGSGERTRGTCQ